MAENTIEGRAKKHDGTAIDYVSIFNWSDGKCIAQVTPNASGSWSYKYFNNLKIGITYIADGCEPITHGAYDFIATWTPFKTQPKLYLDTDSALWSGAVGSTLQVWNDKSANALNFVVNGSITKASDDGLFFARANNFLSNDTVAGKSIFSGVGKAWVFLVFKPEKTEATIFMITNNIVSQPRLNITFEGSSFKTQGSRVSSVESQFSSSVVDDNSYHMVLLEHDWQTGRVAWHINGALDTFNNSHIKDKGLTSTSVASNFVHVGKYATTSANNPQSIKSLIVKTDDNLTQDTIDRLFGYAAHKHGLTAKLPANHPYKNNAPT